ncbi:MAG: hypothetical protein ACYC9L_10980 [Sulfuricaulis sp.]
MTAKSHNSNEPQNRSHYLLYLRTILGLCILAAIIIWVIKKGTLLERLSAPVLFWSTLISLLTSMLHATALASIARAYERKLDFSYALYISALGSLGNAIGGLPLGTTLKYAILYKRIGLKIGQITFGLASYTAGISLVLLVYVAISILFLNFPLNIKVIPAALLVIGIATIVILRYWSKQNRVFSSLLRLFLKRQIAVTVAVLSFSIASLFILNSSIVGRSLFPEHSLIQVVFISATGIFAGLASLLQSVAGIQELTMGLSAFASGINPIDGVQIALVMRIASMISSGLILSLFYLTPGRIPHP